MGVPVVGAVQVTITFEPEFVVVGFPGADGNAAVWIVAPVPKLAEDVVP